MTTILFCNWAITMQLTDTKVVRLPYDKKYSGFLFLSYKSTVASKDIKSEKKVTYVPEGGLR